MKRLFAFLCLLVLCMVPVTAQANDSELYSDGNVQKLFTFENGLLSTSSKAIAQSADGYIWIGGYGGVVRYDGKNFEPWEQGRLANISDLFCDSEGGFWAASSDQGLFRYENGSFVQVPGVKEGTRWDVECIGEDNEGTIWFGTENGIGCFRDETAQMLSIPELSGCFVRHITFASDGRLLLVARDGNVFSYDGETCEKIDLGENNGNIRSIEPDAASDGFYLGTMGSDILKCSAGFEEQEIISAGGLNCLNDLYSKENGVLWICADNGIAVLEDGELRIQRMQVDNSVDLMIEDSEGSMWFVSSRQGVLEVCRGRFENISQIAGLDTLVVNAVHMKDGRLFIGHDDGLIILDADTYEILSLPEFKELESVRIRCIYEDADGSLWICTKGKGALCYQSDGTWKSYTSKEYPEIGSDNFRCIVPAGDKLLAGTDAGAYLIDGDKVENVLNDPSVLTSRVLTAFVDEDGTTYLGTDGYGLYIVKDGEVEKVVNSDTGLTSNVIMRFLKSPEYGIWMVTGNALTLLDPDGNVTTVEDFPSSNILDFILLDNGYVWILTGVGIVETRQEDLLSEEGLAYTMFGHRDGLPFEATANAYQYLDEEHGLLYICGSGGVFTLHTENEDAAAQHFQLSVDSVDQDGERAYISEGQEITVGAETRRIGINAHVLTYTPENPQVFFYLEGFEKEKTVRKLSDLTPISYTNLSGGDYVFHYGIQDPGTGETLQELTLPFTKVSKWYERTGMRILLSALGLLLLTLLVFAIVKRRAHKLQRQLRMQYEQEEKEHLQEMAYKDYLTGLYNRNFLEFWDADVLPGVEFPLQFISVDVNNLKKINDNYGHKQGDQLLLTMTALLRRYFAGETDSLIRMGGDEFLVIVPGISQDEARRRMEDLRKEASRLSIEEYPVTFAYGICEMQEDSFDFEEGLRQSDMEMLKDKARYHGRI
ncbi:MAG: diguanylate cyclase [Blautia sp.]|nr:diguanylate cyclase [Blautia sp.]